MKDSPTRHCDPSVLCKGRVLGDCCCVPPYEWCVALTYGAVCCPCRDLVAPCRRRTPYMHVQVSNDILAKKTIPISPMRMAVGRGGTDTKLS